MSTASGSHDEALVASTLLIRRHVDHELYDESGEPSPAGIAIYSLSDPSDLSTFRYIGQSAAPRRRLFQHLNAARFSMLTDRPWWIRDLTLRPLYEWIRAMYREDVRMPTMVIWEWTDSSGIARVAERARICDGLARGLPLFNVEAERAAGHLLKRASATKIDSDRSSA